MIGGIQSKTTPSSIECTQDLSQSIHARAQAQAMGDIALALGNVHTSPSSSYEIVHDMVI